jgi:hypothetical protein
MGGYAIAMPGEVAAAARHFEERPGGKSRKTLQNFRRFPSRGRLPGRGRWGAHRPVLSDD